MPHVFVSYARSTEAQAQQIAYLHERDAALDLLEPVFAQANRTLFRVAMVDPDLDFLRGDPRFEKAMADAHKRLGLELAKTIPPAT